MDALLILQCKAPLRLVLRWEFITEDKKVRKQEIKNSTNKAIKKTRKKERKLELDQESDKINKKKRKKTRTRPRK